MASEALASFLQKLRDREEAAVEDEEDAFRSLHWLAEYLPTSYSESLQILGILDNDWLKYEKLKSLKSDGLLSICKALQRQLSYPQENIEASSLIISTALKMLEWFTKADETRFELRLPESEKVSQEIFSLSCNICTCLGDCPFLENNEFVSRVESYMCKLLDCLKLYCFQSQKRQVFDTFQKMAAEVLSSALKVLLRLRESFLSTCNKEGFENFATHSDRRVHTVRYGLKMFVDLGCFAMENGKDWVGFLNIAWKCVIALIQTSIGREAFSNLIDIEQVIVAVIHCTLDSLETVAETCKLLLTGKCDGSEVAEFKRLCIPVKFFLINAVRIATSYPNQATAVFREIGACGCKIAAFGHELSKHVSLRFAAEVFAETVEPSLYILLHTLLSSSELAFSYKRLILENVVGIDGDSIFTELNGNGRETKKAITNILSDQEVSVQVSRLTIFLGLLRSCKEYGEDVLFELVKKLDSIFQIISGSKVYPEVFQLHVLVKQSSAKATWQCLYITILKTLQIFFITVADTNAWEEAEAFLFCNILHPHALCRELILDVWCFISRHCETSITEVHIRCLLQILNEFISLRLASHLDWPIQMLGRLICQLVKASPNLLATSAIRDLALGEDLFSSPVKSTLGTILMKEHFPISSLPEELIENIIPSIKKTLYYMASHMQGQVSERAGSMVLPYLAVEMALSCLVEFLIQEHSNQRIKQELSELIKVIVQLLQAGYLNDKNYFLIALHSLKVICRLWQDMQISEIRDVIISLHHLVKHRLSETELMQIKPMLVEALAGLGKVPLPEDKRDPASTALWELYHFTLKERHWAVAHLALASFGYFAAHTSWNELWRFVPPDAALAYDAETGKIAEEDCFMSSLRQFLEKEVTVSVPLSRDNFTALQLEGELLEASLFKRMQAEVKDEPEPQECALEDPVDPDVSMEFVDTQLSLEIDQAMKMLQGGLSLLKEKLSGWLKERGHSTEQQHHMDDQLSLLTDIIAQLDQNVSQYNSEGR